MTSDDDPWSVLGLQRGATRAEVARAWRTLAARHHPDAGGDPERFRALVEARDLVASRWDRHPPVVIVRQRSVSSRLLRPVRRRIDRRLHPRVT